MLFSTMTFSQFQSLPETGGKLFNYLQNPSLNEQQIHYLQAIEENLCNNDYYIVQVNKSVLKSKEAVLINLPQQEELLMTPHAFSKKSDKNLVWKGKGINGSTLKLIINQDKVTGKIRTAKSTYTMLPLSGGLQVLFSETIRDVKKCGML